MKTGFVDMNEVNKCNTFESDLKKLSKEDQSKYRSLSQEVDFIINSFNLEMDEKETIDNKFRKAGYSPGDAEAVLTESKKNKIGKVFKFFGKEYQDETTNLKYTWGDRYFVRTPFNTVVEADVYIETLQDQLINVSNLNTKLTSSSFFGLIKLAFKRLFTPKGKYNG